MGDLEWVQSLLAAGMPVLGANSVRVQRTHTHTRSPQGSWQPDAGCTARPNRPPHGGQEQPRARRAVPAGRQGLCHRHRSRTLLAHAQAHAQAHARWRGSRATECHDRTATRRCIWRANSGVASARCCCSSAARALPCSSTRRACCRSTCAANRATTASCSRCSRSKPPRRSRPPSARYGRRRCAATLTQARSRHLSPSTGWKYAAALGVLLPAPGAGAVSDPERHGHQPRGQEQCTDPSLSLVLTPSLAHGCCARQDGYTALHVASQNGYLPIVQMLVYHGADVAAVTKKACCRCRCCCSSICHFVSSLTASAL